MAHLLLRLSGPLAPCQLDARFFSVFKEPSSVPPGDPCCVPTGVPVGAPLQRWPPTWRGLGAVASTQGDLASGDLPAPLRRGCPAGKATQPEWGCPSRPHKRGLWSESMFLWAQS